MEYYRTKDSLQRLLDAKRITEDEYRAAVDKLENPQGLTEQQVIDRLIEEVMA